jgi:hypothetical protein
MKPNPLRDAAKASGLDRYMPEKPCINGHHCERYVSTNLCVTCKKETFKKAYAKDKDRWLSYAAQWRDNNRQYVNEYSRMYAKTNPKKVKEIFKAYRADNMYKHVANERLAAAKRMGRLPNWITKEHLNQMEQIYYHAETIQKRSGIRMAVDHIVPLKNKKVCGLHVPWNLQIMDFSANCAKHNKITDSVYRPVLDGIMVTGKALPWHWSSK